MEYDIERVLAGAAGAGVQPGAPRAAPQPTTPKADGGKKQLYIGGGVVAALLALVLAISFLSGRGDKPDPGPAPNGPITPPKPANGSGDQDLLKYLRDWVKKHPGEYLGDIRKYEANITKMKDRVVRLQATDDLSTLKREHKQAAEKSFAGIHKKADALIRTGRYAAAAALFENLPRQFAELLADRTNRVARELRKGAEGITRADEFSKAGKPDKGLAELANLTDIKHAAMQTKIRELSERLEAERKNIAERERQRALPAARKAVAKLLEDIEAAVARGDLAEAGRAADAALQDEKLRPAEAALKPIAAVGQALGKMAVCDKASPSPKLKEQVGREVTLATKQSSIKGILKQVTDKIVVIEKKFKIGDEWKTKTHTVPIADLTEETLRQFRPEWTAKSRDDHIAVAMVALKEKDIARAEAALKAAPAPETRPSSPP